MFSYPLRGDHPITGRFEPRKQMFINGVWTLPFHYGVDWAAPAGTPVHAIGAGRVKFAGWDYSGYGGGWQVFIDHGNGVTSHYLHLRDNPPVKTGQQIGQGQQIGVVGSTGLSTGNHLHLEIQEHDTAVDPLPLLSNESESSMTIYIRRGSQSKVYAVDVVSGAKRPIDTWEWEVIKKAYGAGKLALPIVNVSAADANRYGI